MENKIGENNPNIWKGVKFWTDEIRKAGVYDSLRRFNDVLTGKKAPQGYGDRF